MTGCSLVTSWHPSCVFEHVAKRPRHTNPLKVAEPAVWLILGDPEAEQKLDQQHPQPQCGASSSQTDSGGGIGGGSGSDRGSLDQTSRSHGLTAKSSVGVAALVGPRVALTALHNLPLGSAVGYTGQLVQPRSAAAGSSKLGSTVVNTYPTKDLAVLSVFHMEQQQQQQQQQQESPRGWFTLYDGDVQDLVGTTLWLVTCHLALQPSLPEFDTSLGLMHAHPIKVCGKGEQLLYSATTYKGDSGSPLLTADGRA